MECDFFWNYDRHMSTDQYHTHEAIKQQNVFTTPNGYLVLEAPA